MSENLQEIMREALLNNTYDYEPMHNTIKRTWMNSFSYLYSLQKARVEYEEIFYISNDEGSRNSKLIGSIHLDKKLRPTFTVDYDLIHVLSREEFRLSKFYLKEFTVKDIAYNPEIFLKLPIVIIDDQVIWDYKINVTKDSTEFILPLGKKFVISPERKPVTEEIIYLEHKIQVLIVDNIFYQRLTFNKSSLSFNKNEKTIKIEKSLINERSSDIIYNDTVSSVLGEYGISSVGNLNNNQKYVLDKEYRRRLNATQLPTQRGTMMCSLHFPNNVGKTFELGSQMIPLEDVGDYFIAHLTDDVYEKISAHRFDIYVSLYYVNRLNHHKFYTGLSTTEASSDGADLLVVQEDEMVPYKSPIPVENFMVFKKSQGTGFTLKKNTEMIEMYYPNIYRIKDKDMVAGDVYDIYYFYYDEPDLKYTVLFDFYYTFLVHLCETKSIENIINDIYYNRLDLSMYSNTKKTKFSSIFKKLLKYQYHNHQYGETDFLYRYLPIPGNEDKEPIEYKMETLREWIRVEPWVLRDYVLEQNKLGASYHLFTNTINLKSRIRYSTEQELGRETRRFDEPRYVFAFNNDKDYPILLNCRVFVDGLLIGDIYQERHLFMDYLYIPMNMVTDDSYIEIEIFPGYEFERDIFFSTQKSNIKIIGNVLSITIDEDVVDEPVLNLTDEIGVIEADGELDINDYNKQVRVDIDKPSEDIFPTMEDIHLVNNQTNEAYHDEEFDFTVHYPENDYVLLNGESGTEKPIDFTRISSFSIKPHERELLRKPMTLKITKVPRNVRFVVKRQGYVYISLAEKGLILDTNYIRVYKNGRLLPRVKYVVYNGESTPKILFLDWFCPGDIIYIDITPYRYKELYYQDRLIEGNLLIDLREIIDKPFDIRYYDVYVNGRKLSLNNVFSITPWQITLVNLKSIYNLVIYERERDYEYFGLDYKENIYYYTLDDLFKSGIVSKDIKNEIIKDIIDKNKDYRLNIYPNTNDEERMNQDAEDIFTVEFYLYYYDRLLPFSFVNPDLLQESRDFLLSGFEDVYNSYRRSSSEESFTDEERERRQDYPEVICLDPDLHFSAEGGEPGPKLIYEVGHMTDDDVIDTFLNQGVKYPEDIKIDDN